MEILIVSHFFAPDPCAPAARLSDLARYWTQRGQRVQVLTSFPHHPTGVVPRRYHGRVHVHEQMDGFDVHRCYLYARPGGGFGSRGLGHLAFMVSAVVFGARRIRCPDIIVVSSPTLFSVVSAWWIARRYRVPFVFEVRDLWPDAFAELGVLRNRFALSLFQRLARWLYRQAAHIVVVTESFGDRLVATGVPRDKISFIPNGVDLDFFARTDEYTDGSGKGIGSRGSGGTVLYCGAHGISHGLAAILEAAARCQEDLPGWLFLFVGEGSEKQALMSRAESMGLDNVEFRPAVDHAAVPRLYQDAQICLVPLQKARILEIFIPSKMFEIMAAMRPIVASLRGEARRILERSGAAVVVDPEDAGAICTAVRELAADAGRRATMGSAGREFVRRYYNRRQQADLYERLLESILLSVGSAT